MFMLGVHGKSDPLVLKLWVVVNYDMGSRNPIWFFYKSSKCSSLWSRLFSSKVHKFLNGIFNRSVVVLISPNTPSSILPSPLLPLFNTNSFLIPFQTLNN